MTDDEACDPACAESRDPALSDAARRMGQSTSDAKTIAARKNGQLGGRPKGMKLSDEVRRKISEGKRKRKDGESGAEADTHGQPNY